MQKIKHNVVGWFELPARDLDRAMKFYQTVFGLELERHQMGEMDMAWFPWVENTMGAGGALVRHDSYKPSADGILVYFTAPSGDLSQELSRVEDAGGKVLLSRRLISEDIGYMAIVLDTEGNRVALHSRK